MSMKLIFVAWLVVAGVAAACRHECFDGKNKYSCNCTATCNGQPVSSFSTPCGYDNDEATDSAQESCQNELSACGSITCSCNCSDTGNECATKTCR